MVGDHIRPANSAEEDRVELTQLILPTIRQHLAVLLVVLDTREVEPFEPHVNTMTLSGSFDGLHTKWHDLFSDAISRNDCNLRHVRTSTFLCVGPVLVGVPTMR